jgi:cytochrome P450
MPNPTLEASPLGDMEFWARPEEEREEFFRFLRDEHPVSFHPEPQVENFPRGPGYWAVVRHADVVHVSRHPELFCSGRGGSNIGDVPQEMAEYLGSIINMDDPRHRQLRNLVSHGFTPRELERLLDDVKRRARAVVDAVAPLGACDAVADIAAPLPLQIICDMVGVPPSMEQTVFEASNVILGFGDPEYVTGVHDLMGAFHTLHGLATELGEHRLREPADDLTSILMHAEVDGRRLTVGEFASFFILLVVAGNETTRTAISHGLWALHTHPDQKRLWMERYDELAQNAIEEIVRWATPVIHFRRTATRDTEIAGQPVAAGEKVVMWYNSANRDERVFDDPYRFDLTRFPNPHVAFGGGGPHFCLGANLARREMRVMFEELFRRLPDLEITESPVMLRSGFIHGIKRMPCRFTPRAPERA